MGITRLNIQTGIAGMYYLREEFDAGRGGQPARTSQRECEIAHRADRTVNADGSLQPMMATYIPKGYNQSGSSGMWACVDGMAWPLP
ncbi:hypothetical protein [Nocardia sp. NBC_01388]|uniref:hypothetical protein n=1 Tax=Nocardia sp. NBC_01388 TaxID=2903596 RepID=UPI003247C84E